MTTIQLQEKNLGNDFFDFNELKDNYTTVTAKKKQQSHELETFIQTIVEEVRKSPSRKQKQFIKTLWKSCLLLLPFVPMNQAHAQSLNVSSEKLKFPLIDQLYDIAIIPNEIVTILIQIIQASALVGIAISILLLIVSGIRRSFGQSIQSNEMNRNVILGLLQILTAPIVILLLAAFTIFMLGGVGADIDIFSK